MHVNKLRTATFDKLLFLEVVILDIAGNMDIALRVDNKRGFLSYTNLYYLIMQLSIFCLLVIATPLLIAIHEVFLVLFNW